MEPRVKLYESTEESFLATLKYIDVTRTTSTSLDVMLEKMSTIIWTLMEFETCQIRGLDSHDSLNWVRNHRMDTHGAGRDWRENKRPQGPTHFGQKCGNICLMHQNVKRNKSVLEKTKLDNARKLGDIYFISSWRGGTQGYHEECSWKVWHSDASNNAL